MYKLGLICLGIIFGSQAYSMEQPKDWEKTKKLYEDAENYLTGHGGKAKNVETALALFIEADKNGHPLATSAITNFLDPDNLIPADKLEDLVNYASQLLATLDKENVRRGLKLLNFAKERNHVPAGKFLEMYEDHSQKS